MCVIITKSKTHCVHPKFGDWRSVKLVYFSIDSQRPRFVQQQIITVNHIVTNALRRLTSIVRKRNFSNPLNSRHLQSVQQIQVQDE